VKTYSMVVFALVTSCQQLVECRQGTAAGLASARTSPVRMAQWQFSGETPEYDFVCNVSYDTEKGFEPSREWEAMSNGSRTRKNRKGISWGGFAGHRDSHPTPGPGGQRIH